MYIVVSRWEALPGKWSEFEATGKKMRAAIRTWPEVEMVHGVRISEDAVFAIIGYKTEADYQRLIQAENGPFQQLAQQHNIESIAKWVWSERGEASE